jgi:hypothetical protein
MGEVVSDVVQMMEHFPRVCDSFALFIWFVSGDMCVHMSLKGRPC